MDNKIIKSFLFAACFVVQATGAMGSSSASQPAETETSLQQKIDLKAAELSKLPNQIQAFIKQIKTESAGIVNNANEISDIINSSGYSLASSLRAFSDANSTSLGNFITRTQSAIKEAQQIKEAAWLSKDKKQAHWDKLKSLGQKLTALQNLTTTQQTLEATQSNLSRQLATLKQQKEEQERKDAEERVRVENERKAEEKLKAQEAEQIETARIEAERLSEIKRKEAEALQVAKAEWEAKLNENAPIVQGLWKVRKARQQLKELKTVKQQEKAFVSNFLGFLGGAPSSSLTTNSREEKLVSWSGSSYKLFSAYSWDSNPDYTFVKTQAKANQYGDLFDLAVSHRAHSLNDSHADNNWTLKAREMGDDNLPAAVKLVRRCTQVLSKDNEDASPDVLKAIAEMAEDTLATGGRIGIDLRRQATAAELAVMIPALRQSGQRALLAAASKVENALESLARIYLDAAFKSAGFLKSRDHENLFNSHKAHCFIAATRGLKDCDDLIDSNFGSRLGMNKAQIQSTKQYYDSFD
ncbi:hypothetical protein [Candidatus Finniella inopinata]|uniref:Uncharacterized protein n=1 Tax=Candidatus Finniella inopinata TaxID=1696036 RepID=A0A4Q7DH70_9PROT|nr:hypothetical protein [Candidatus Finniella inopinata]RZI45660.1 hypothetical protein EQU50_06045 [Candidatus Finniella inopinata]